ncbi:L-lactate dehydrogenase [Desulfocurvus sp. DL9XJH121]
MPETHVDTQKIAVIGAGMVGTAFAYAAVLRGTAHELVLVDKNMARAEGEAMDLSHAMALCPPTGIHAGGYEDCADADIVVITAGAAQRQGETRLDLVGRNAAITRNIVAEVMRHAKDPILILVTNPVDVLTHVALKESGLPPSRVIGSGTVLDSARFRLLLSRHCGVDPRNVHGHIVGEHGDSETALWSRVNIGGVLLDEFCALRGVPSCGEDFRTATLDRVRKAAYEIIERKGSTYFGIGMCLIRIVEAILGDEHSVLTVSALLDGEYGISDVCLSLPRVITRAGVESTIHAGISDEELGALRHSAEVIRKTLASVAG